LAVLLVSVLLSFLSYNDINECLLCTVCPTTAYARKCSLTMDAECTTDPMIVFARNTGLTLFSVYLSAVILYYVAMPITDWYSEKPKLS